MAENTDRELLELAAKAAGLDTTHKMNAERLRISPPVDALWVKFPNGKFATGWNPLTDDGDALRLAVRLHFDLRFHWNGCDDQYDEVEAYTHGAKKDASEEIGFYLNGGQLDEFAATRRAIVRAAAEVGKGMLSHDEFALMFPDPRAPVQDSTK
jgi:hypothetical protein